MPGEEVRVTWEWKPLTACHGKWNIPLRLRFSSSQRTSSVLLIIGAPSTKEEKEEKEEEEEVSQEIPGGLATLTSVTKDVRGSTVTAAVIVRNTTDSPLNVTWMTFSFSDGATVTVTPDHVTLKPRQSQLLRVNLRGGRHAVWRPLTLRWEVQQLPTVQILSWSLLWRSEPPPFTPTLTPTLTPSLTPTNSQPSLWDSTEATKMVREILSAALSDSTIPETIRHLSQEREPLWAQWTLRPLAAPSSSRVDPSNVSNESNQVGVDQVEVSQVKVDQVKADQVKVDQVEVDEAAELTSGVIAKAMSQLLSAAANGSFPLTVEPLRVFNVTGTAPPLSRDSQVSQR